MSETLVSLSGQPYELWFHADFVQGERGWYATALIPEGDASEAPEPLGPFDTRKAAVEAIRHAP